MNKNIEEPYMDEYFHHYQTHEYLNGNFKYHEKITTPPGTYISVIPFLKLLNFTNFKEIEIERFIISFVFGSLTLFLLYKIFSNQKKRDEQSLEKALLFLTIPTIFFYFYLYYTDAVSLVYILFAFYAIQNDQNFLSGIASGLSVLTRQNNIIWVFYIVAWKYLQLKKDYLQALSTYLANLIFTSIIDLPRIIIKFIYHFLVFIGFLVFVWKNQGIAIGHKEFHSLNFHPTQLLYFFAFALLFLPLSCRQYYEHLKLFFKQLLYQKAFRILYFLILGICLLIVNQFTIIHKFLVSDNRHYSYYLARYLLIKWTLPKYIACVIYSFAICFIFTLYTISREKVIRFILWFVCVSLALMPASLIELRYFTMPLFFLINEIEVNQSENEKKEIKKCQENLLVNIAFNLLLSLAILSVFIFVPIKLPNFDEKIRLIF